MALKTFVKVGNISNLSDARYCAGMGAEMLGFRVIEGQEHYISPKAFQEIRGWITGPKVVAELYGMQSPSQLASILEQYRPDLLELGDSELSLFPEGISLPFIYKGEQKPKVENVAYLLTEGVLNTNTNDIPVLVSVESKQHAEETLAQNTSYGLALYGNIEEKVGLNDMEVLADIFEMLEDD